MIPDFNDDGNLPPGIHQTTLAEVEARFATNPHRQWLIAGVRRVAFSLKSSGCQTLYLDGSLVTSKRLPSDFDGCWERSGVNLLRLFADDPVLFDFRNRRAAQKAKYHGELFPADFIEGDSGLAFLIFFQRDKDTGRSKGILALDLESLT